VNARLKPDLGTNRHWTKVGNFLAQGNNSKV